VDLDGTGRPAAAAGGRFRVLVVDAKGEERFELEAGRTTRGFRMAMPAPVDLDGDGRSELAVLFGPELSVFDAKGQRVYGSTTAEYHFTSVAPAPRPAAELLLGSIVGPDENL